MQRSAGVTIVAVFEFLGSLLTLGMAALMVAAFASAPKKEMPSSPGMPMMSMTVLMGFAVAMYLLPAIWGFITAAGVWRLKNWARISTIVFAVILCFFGLFSCFGALAMPIFLSSLPQQQDVPTAVKSLMIVFMLAIGLGQIGIGLWWAIYFTRRNVIAQFARTTPVLPPVSYELAPATPTLSPPPITRPRRPLSISIIAWFLLVSAVFFLPSVFLLHTPQVLFGRLLTGPAAAVMTTVYLLFVVFIGIGLLKLWPAARVVGIAYFAFGILNVAVTWLRPGASDLFQQMISAQSNIFGPQPPMAFPESFFRIIMVVTSLVMVVPIYFLIAKKKAFEESR